MGLALECGQEPIEILDCDWVRPERGFDQRVHNKQAVCMVNVHFLLWVVVKLLVKREESHGLGKERDSRSNNRRLGVQNHLSLVNN
jgi:hypothetical protein